MVRIGALESSPPMSYRDSSGRLTGFTVEILRAICDEMKARCEFQYTTLEQVIDSVSNGEFDIAAVGLLDTPERRNRVIFSDPYFRSVTLWFAKPGVQPGDPGVRIAAVKGSAQERYARQHGWDTVGVVAHTELVEPLSAGVAQAMMLPMSVGLVFMRSPEFRKLGTNWMAMKAPELTGDALLPITPKKPQLRDAVNAALERIKRNGTYDRINSQFLPLRIS